MSATHHEPLLDRIGRKVQEGLDKLQDLLAPAPVPRPVPAPVPVRVPYRR